MPKLTRRTALRSVGILGAVATTRLGFTSNARGNADGKPSAQELLTKITLTDEQWMRSGVLTTPGQTPAAFGPKQLGLRSIPTAKAEGFVTEIKDGSGTLISYALSFTAFTNAAYYLYVNGQNVRARRFSYSVTDISWQPGTGWPVYHSYCPRDDYGTTMNWPNAKIHQIVPVIFDTNYFVGCSSSATCEGTREERLLFVVNDDNYGDNRGTYQIHLHSIG